MTNTAVRRATTADLQFLHANNMAMAAETEDRGLDQDTLRRGIAYLLEHPAEGFYLVAEREGTAVGSLMVTFEWSDWRNGRFWWIQSVYVPPSYRRQGVYRAMHDAVHNLAADDAQLCGIRLYVERDNVRAQRTYIEMGMHETHYRLFEEAPR